MLGLFKVAVPIWEANNFNNWWFRVETISKREQFEDVLLQNYESMTTENEKKELLKRDARAQSVIVQGFADKHLDIIEDSETAKDQRDALKKLFARSSSFTKLSTWRKLMNLKTTCR
ncbi:hypothetical protein WA026_023519 [Henosepilachna vigintioctopunctata]|uniref:Uncharacterized protein n=1 Tax=Henosepilachna vigintioctopunctata TaxID=420089 RepID=A0AAW1TQ39_9CUCU